MVAFYVWPALAVALVAAARAGRVRLAASVAVATGVSVVAQWQLGELPWWSIVTVGIVAVLALGAPRSRVPADEYQVPFTTDGSESRSVLAGTAA